MMNRLRWWFAFRVFHLWLCTFRHPRLMRVVGRLALWTMPR